MSTTQEYVGSELELFARAANWKAYLRRRILPHLRGCVLEVGAGNGANTSSLVQSTLGLSRWVCLEPDQKLAAEISARELKLASGAPVEVRAGLSRDLAADDQFDAVLYIDVLEHIDDDAEELSRITSHLRPGGKLVVLSPAHQFLFSPFDSSIGHFRRYNRASLCRAVPPSLRRLELRYLDSVGFFASLANRTLLQKSMPTEKQILFWDGVLVRLSRVTDPLLGFRMGKSLLGVWEKI